MVEMGFTSVTPRREKKKKRNNFYTQQMWDGGKHLSFLNQQEAERTALQSVWLQKADAILPIIDSKCQHNKEDL